uniref:Coiled-coil domain containing 70 n=1 Tax=Anolis carolinensis TaxID=28377 RepID=H9GQT9_ANOCA
SKHFHWHHAPFLPSSLQKELLQRNLKDEKVTLQNEITLFWEKCKELRAEINAFREDNKIKALLEAIVAFKKKNRSFLEEIKNFLEESRTFMDTIKEFHTEEVEQKNKAFWKECKVFWKKDKAFWEEDMALSRDKMALWEEYISLRDNDQNLQEEKAGMWDMVEALWDAKYAIWKEINGFPEDLPHEYDIEVLENGADGDHEELSPPKDNPF